MRPSTFFAILFAALFAFGPTATEAATRIKQEIFPGAASKVHVRIYEDGSGTMSYTAHFRGGRHARVRCGTSVPW